MSLKSVLMQKNDTVVNVDEELHEGEVGNFHGLEGNFA